jgi:hypothetical protein
MKKSSSKKSAAKQPSAPTSAGAVTGGVVVKQPQVKEQAAIQHGMFLYTDDSWSQRYFDQNDLRFKEREVFG